MNHNNDICGTDFVIGGFRYQELKRDEKAGVQLWSAVSVYGDINNPSAGYSVTVKPFCHFEFPRDPMHHFQFSMNQKAQAEKLFDALANTDKASQEGRGRGFVEDLRRRPAPLPQIF